MASRSNEQITSTADLVDLTNYLNTCMSETFFKMKQNITEAMQRVLFLLDYYVYNGMAHLSMLQNTILKF